MEIRRWQRDPGGDDAATDLSTNRTMTVGNVAQRSAELIADMSAMAAACVQKAHEDFTFASGDQIEFAGFLVVNDHYRGRAETHGFYQRPHFSVQ